MDGDIFVATSPRGNIVHCERSRWEEHVVSNKPIMKNTEYIVKQTIEAPYAIYGSDEYINRDVYFGPFKGNNNLVTKVIVENRPNFSVVITAFPQKDISGNINEEDLKYVKPKLLF